MRVAYQQITEVMHSNPKVSDLRTASFAVAIEKIARTYSEMGL